MDFVKMLQDKECSCGMVHSCSIKNVIIGKGAINQLVSLLGEYKKIQDALWYAKDLKDRYSVLWMYYDLLAGKY